MNNYSLPQIEGGNVITHSRIASFRNCPRRHHYEYNLGIRPASQVDYFRIGHAIHLGLDLRAQGMSVLDAITGAVCSYQISSDEIEYEKATVVQLLDGYFRKWESESVSPDIRVDSVIATEYKFDIPIVGHLSKRASGKIDKIVRLGDGRIAVMEHKTTGSDIDPDSDYWKRLRIDQQISMYMLAAKIDGHNPETVLYDVIKKPTIEPKRIPLLDSDGYKIVVDRDGNRVMTKDGKKPRETADKELGYQMQTRAETVEEWNTRLFADILANPDKYYQRQEIVRLQDDIEEFVEELFSVTNQIADAIATGSHPRNTGACIQRTTCPFLEVCKYGFNGSTGIPQGFRQTQNIHEEL